MSTRAAMILLQTCFTMKPRVQRQLLLKFPKAQVLEASNPLSYDAVRACAFVAGEDPAPPHMVTLLCRMSCVQRVFFQLANYTASDSPRPDTPEQEILGSSFLYNSDLDIITPAYRVLAGKEKRAEAIDTRLRHQFGDILRDEEYAQQIRLSYSHGGATTNTIPADLAYVNGVVTNPRELEDFVEFRNHFSQCSGNLAAQLAVAQNTLHQLTVFQPPGGGRPQLSSAFVHEVISNKGKWIRGDSEELPCTEVESGKNMEELFRSMQDETGEATRARELMVRVLREVVYRACEEAQPIVSDDEEDEEDE